MVSALDQFVRLLVAERLERQGRTVEPAVQHEMEQALLGRAGDLINRRLIEALSEEAADRLELLVDSEDVTATDMQRFMDANLPNQSVIITAALSELRDLYLGI